MGNMLRQIVAPLQGPGNAKDPFLMVYPLFPLLQQPTVHVQAAIASMAIVPC